MEMPEWEERHDTVVERDNDDRTNWQRDYARLIHSAAFRRLQSKTQVLGLGESDFYRTRLTHSMEVAQIGTSILRYLKKHSQHFDILPDESLMTAVCLAHDIGHPPFGHGGETALNYCMQKAGGFEGNGQTLRILSKLEKYSEHDGLNATRRMLLGILKYPVSYKMCTSNIPDVTDNNKSWLFKSNNFKPPKCYLDTEYDIVNWILKPFGTEDKNKFTEATCGSKYKKSKYKSLDTSIMEIADDISYSIHDLEDAIALGMVKREMFDDISEDIFSVCGLNKEHICNSLFSEKTYKIKEVIGSLVHCMVSNVYLSIPKDIFSHPLLNYNAILDINYEKLRSSLHTIVRENVIKTPNVQLLEFKGQKIVVELFEVLSSDPERFLPKTQKTLYKNTDDDSMKHRIICDYIAGMTDDYATRLYEKIFNTHRGSVFDRL
jgi:dGTPase